MINQIKHNSPSSVLSQFNPVASLKPKTRKAVNERFILPILTSFFANKGGISNFSELDTDKLITEIEFVKTENFVKTYIYKEIINEISKQGKKVEFKPKYVITFDRDLANFKRDETIYPYNAIFNINSPDKNHIKYGVIRLGEAPILYYILIDLQQIIKFIKNLPEEVEILETGKVSETEEEKRNKLFDTVIFDKQRQLRNANQVQKVEIEQEISRLEQVRQTVLEGQSGKLRINLAWNTTDDLDLHIQTPNGTIFYNKKTVENQGIIGQLDVDKNAGSDIVSNPQENINFNAMPTGLHKIFVNFYAQRERNEVPFTLTIIPENGEGRIFNKTVVGKGTNKNVATFEYKDGELEFNELA
jgi:hypothetical protein